MVFACFLDQSMVDVLQGRGSWADVAMNAAFMLMPAVGGAAIAKVAKKFANAADGAGDAARALNKADDLADGAKAVRKADNVGDDVLIRYMTNDEYEHLKSTGELKFGKPKVYATSERLTTNVELSARGGVVEPKQWGVKFRVDGGHFQPNGVAKYPNSHPWAGKEIPGGIPEFFSAGPVRVNQITVVWPIT